MSNTTQLTLGQSTNISPKTSIQSVYLEQQLDKASASPISKNILIVHDANNANNVNGIAISENPNFSLLNSKIDEQDIVSCLNKSATTNDVELLTSLKFGTVNDVNSSVNVLCGINTTSLKKIIEFNDDHIKGRIREWIDYSNKVEDAEHKITIGAFSIKGNTNVIENTSSDIQKDYVIETIDYEQVLQPTIDDFENRISNNTSFINQLNEDLSNIDISVYVSENSKNVLKAQRMPIKPGETGKTYNFQISLNTQSISERSKCLRPTEKSMLKKCYVGSDGLYFRDHPDSSIFINSSVLKDSNDISTSAIISFISKVNNGTTITSNSTTLEIKNESYDSYIYVNGEKVAFLGNRFAKTTTYETVEIPENEGHKFHLLTSDRDSASCEELAPWLCFGKSFYIQKSKLYVPSTVQTPSDINLKTNIDYITDASMRIAEFDWKSNGAHSAGFIAQDLEKEGLGWIVSTDTDTSLKSVDYTSAFAIKIAQLENRIKQLENELQVLQLQQHRRLGGY